MFTATPIDISAIMPWIGISCAVVIALAQWRAARLAKETALITHATKQVAEASVEASRKNAASLSIVSRQVTIIAQHVDGRLMELTETMLKEIAAAVEKGATLAKEQNAEENKTIAASCPLLISKVENEKKEKPDEHN